MNRPHKSAYIQAVPIVRACLAVGHFAACMRLHKNPLMKRPGEAGSQPRAPGVEARAGTLLHPAGKASQAAQAGR